MRGDSYDFPEYQSEAFYERHRHLTGGELFATALCARLEAQSWHSAYIRAGDAWFKPRLTNQPE